MTRVWFSVSSSRYFFIRRYCSQFWHLACLAVCYKFVGVECNVETEVVVNHYLESLAFEAFALVLVDGLGLDVAFGTPAVGVDAAARAQFLEKFGSHFFVEFLGNITQGVFEGGDGFFRGKGEAAVGGTAYSFDEGRHLGKHGVKKNAFIIHGA